MVLWKVWLVEGGWVGHVTRDMDTCTARGLLGLLLLGGVLRCLRIILVLVLVRDSHLAREQYSMADIARLAKLSLA